MHMPYVFKACLGSLISNPVDPHVILFTILIALTYRYSRHFLCFSTEKYWNQKPVSLLFANVQKDMIQLKILSWRLPWICSTFMVELFAAIAIQCVYLSILSFSLLLAESAVPVLDLNLCRRESQDMVSFVSQRYCLSFFLIGGTLAGYSYSHISAASCCCSLTFKARNMEAFIVKYSQETPSSLKLARY